MKCPNCSINLEVSDFKGMELNKCPKCGGDWFDFKELDQLEDLVLSDDEMKGTLVWDKKPSKKKCPKCNKQMVGFNYRLNDVYLEYCENMHGYWLDSGEKERVIEEMKESVNKLDKKFDAEEKWANHMKQLQTSSFFSKLRNLLR
ncbi:hypothetical protein A3C23_03915 [Candidatus Roizmanbacteria bacterium RIFCSPHIGHO2_02_FULL_37_13b]|uniref:Transcription factor zinc-finger domain-containing protein n=1 Tax=Candidatus Roizmanbacteria bacterium RIFCSPLOWO2_02_FULL_36_11 TaxID=1802071 RepID=A0A1F7JC85_9BACT|nr:MAG: hypothetical protein A3C23_03915 [Candidatus Roizmanbacteria bacterium RIFCSPHIGHO2_02_FULL_37_13b]OGK53175.1 MAG: hypothetical protein A3H78_06215 [Candidatus Roizmanbacteria bacterium RIFCSPLOWO2_02_FULL_36_11]